ncbi:MAG: phosphotransferase [Myxococcota bacterium]|nr:phosphotransferase [Myxococcota bacterium]
MSVIDNRTHHRITMDETDDTYGGMRSAYVVLTLGNERVLGKVLDISTGGVGIRVAVSVSKDISNIPSAGTLLKNIVVGTATLNRTLRLMVIRHIKDADADSWVLGLEASDADSRSCLWQIFRELKNVKSAEEYDTGEIPDSIQKIPARGHYTEEARQERLTFIREFTGQKLDKITNTSLPVEKLTGNIENLVGSVEIPVGLAGPLFFRGQNVRGIIYAPMGTSEGALVASATRGATAITEGGGVQTKVLRQRMIRVPYFRLGNTEQASKLRDWMTDHIDEIRAQTRLVSNYANLKEVYPNQVGSDINAHFIYETGDAAGQNMTTTCTWKACNWILEQMTHFPDIQIQNFVIDANMSGDKKANFQSYLLGRGTRVTAECFIPGPILRKILKVDPDQLEDMYKRSLRGSVAIGTLGYNINIANVIGAMFTATGQDIASVHESSIGQLVIESIDDGLYASMDLPALIVGSVGGGTNLPHQQNYLEILDCAGVRKSGRLAEIIAGFCLALDLSTLSAVASGQFASAHERLGRNRPVDWFTAKDLTPAFFTPGVQKLLQDTGIQVHKVEPIEMKMGSSIITELTARRVKKLVGLFPFKLSLSHAKSGQTEQEVLIKIKPNDQEVIVMVNAMARMCDAKLASAHDKNKHRLGFQKCHIRELAIYEQSDPRFLRYTPEIYRTFRDDTREAYAVVMEKLDNMELINTADDTTNWTDKHINAAIDGLAELQSIWWRREEELQQQEWLGTVMTANDMQEMHSLWETLAYHAYQEFPDWFSHGDLSVHQKIVSNIGEWWSEIEKMPRTLIHNDFNPRNMCFRKDANDNLRLCAYDWELATLHIPQRDLVEFLCFTLPRNYDYELIVKYSERHRRKLESATGDKIDQDTWKRGFSLAVRDFGINRLAMYLMAHTFRNYGFIEHVYMNLRRMIKLDPHATEYLED